METEINGILDFLNMMGTYSGYAAVIFAVTQLLKTVVFKKAKGFGVQLIAIFVGVAVAFGAALLDIGIFGQYHGSVGDYWYALIAIGAVTALGAMGASTLPKLQNLLNAFFKAIGLPVIDQTA